jgi:hypothetical protein
MDDRTTHPHDITMTVEVVEAHDRERQRFDDSIEVFARNFASDCGEPISDGSYFVGWERHAGRIHATFEYSDQCGGGKEYVKFPILALSDPVERNAAVEGRIADIEIKRFNEREAETRRLQAESARLLKKIEERQRSVAVATGLAT